MCADEQLPVALIDDRLPARFTQPELCRPDDLDDDAVMVAMAE